MGLSECFSAWSKPPPSAADGRREEDNNDMIPLQTQVGLA